MPSAAPPSPSADSDGDRIPDVRDECPEIAEDYEGTLDEDGCPDDGNGHHVATPWETLNSLRQYYIRFRMGSAAIDVSQGPLLDDFVKKTLDLNPNLRLALIGTADAPGASRREQRLGEARARAVQDHLVRMGIAPSRLVTRTRDLGLSPVGQVKVEGKVSFEIANGG